MDDHPPGKVDGTDRCEPAAAPDPVGDGIIDKVVQSREKRMNEMSFTRSASPEVTIATVTAANVIWKIIKRSGG